MAFEQSVFDEALYKRPVNAVLLRPLAELMKVSLVLNEKDQAWLLHDKVFSDVVMWAEYDIDTGVLTLIQRGGKIQELGLKIPHRDSKHLRKVRQLFTMLLEGDDVIDTYILPLLIRETGHYRA